MKDISQERASRRKGKKRRSSLVCMKAPVRRPDKDTLKEPLTQM
jgi:hypothetical protein